MTFHINQTQRKSYKYCQRNEVREILLEVGFSREFWCLFTNEGLPQEGGMDMRGTVFSKYILAWWGCIEGVTTQVEFIQFSPNLVSF